MANMYMYMNNWIQQQTWRAITYFWLLFISALISDKLYQQRRPYTFNWTQPSLSQYHDPSAALAFHAPIIINDILPLTAWFH